MSDLVFSDEVPKLSPIQQQRKRSRTLVSPPSNSNDLKGMAVQALQSMSQSQPRDSFTALGEYIACELRSLTREQAMYAKQKLIRTFNEIMEEAVLIVSMRLSPILFVGSFLINYFVPYRYHSDLYQNAEMIHKMIT